METGLLLIFLAFFFNLAATLSFFLAFRQKNPKIAEVAEILIYSALALTTAAVILLVYYFLTDNFSLYYVYVNSQRAMSNIYKLSAIWAGKEGSLLLWNFFNLLVLSIFLSYGEKNLAKVKASLLASGISSYLLFLLILTSNPFESLPTSPLDGVGMNPLLRTPEMIFHPPLVFLAYSFSIIPFAMHFVKFGDPYKYMRAAFIFLTLGIFLGGFWAYRTLGWGGFWGWDPVENASLLPWLAMAAYIHSKNRSFFAYINFLFVILATFITRSGIISSVHSFSDGGGELYIVLIIFAGILAFKELKGGFKDPCQASYIFSAMIIVVAMGTFANLFFDVNRLYFLTTFIPLFALLIFIVVFKIRMVKRRLLLHFGLILLFIGALSVWGFEEGYTIELSPSAEVEGIQFVLKNISLSEDAEKYTFTVQIESKVGNFSPKMYVYKTERQNKVVSAVDIRSDFLKDYYVAVKSVDVNLKSAVINFYVVPLVSLVWLGAAVTFIGIIVKK
ncbi:MAG: cytochrome c biogenesis protein CcsA [Archaeoglobaceae archaeon]